jgi:CheY-like chemotaxis protein
VHAPQLATCFLPSIASPRTHVEYGGSGLGLFISRKLTEMQGGAIGFASEFGKGSTFAFYVRAQRAPRPQSGLSASDLSELNAVDEYNKLAILVVEDNLVNQRVLCKQLRTHGHVVYAANHGGEAIAFLQESKFWKDRAKTGGKPLSLVLMDTEMPIMDGLTCVRKIRELQREGSIIGHVPIISVTANARSEQIEVATTAGMVSFRTETPPPLSTLLPLYPFKANMQAKKDDVVSKPFHVLDLIPKMQSLVQRYHS